MLLDTPIMSAQPFGFGFENEDIDDAASEVEQNASKNDFQQDVRENLVVTDTAPKRHHLHDMVRAC